MACKILLWNHQYENRRDTKREEKFFIAPFNLRIDPQRNWNYLHLCSTLLSLLENISGFPGKKPKIVWTYTNSSTCGWVILFLFIEWLVASGLERKLIIGSVGLYTVSWKVWFFFNKCIIMSMYVTLLLRKEYIIFACGRNSSYGSSIWWNKKRENLQ